VSAEPTTQYNALNPEKLSSVTVCKL
jgi:hypothetical protein